MNKYQSDIWKLEVFRTYLISCINELSKTDPTQFHREQDFKITIINIRKIIYHYMDEINILLDTFI